jgi:hypothetical protein
MLWTLVLPRMQCSEQAREKAMRVHWRITAATAVLVSCSLVSAQEATVIEFPILTPIYTQVYNDRIGNSRFFGGPNTDRVRVSAFVLPSPDTDVYPVTSPTSGITYLSNNGASTSVSVTHPSGGPLAVPRALTFVGLTSGRGGGRDEFTWSVDRNAPDVAALLQAWDQTPFEIMVRNPRAAGGITSLSVAASDFDAQAMPAFITDLTLTGGGLQPRLDWVIPDTGAAPTAMSIQIRRIDAESADRTRINSATLLHYESLPAGTTSYTFGETFINASIPGFPSGLEQGQRYEIAVQMDIETPAGDALGRSRTFFEFAPLDPDAPNVSVYLPSVGPDGKFKFDVAVKQGERIAIDPVVAIGYDYAIGDGDPSFRSVILPDIGDGKYELWLEQGGSFAFKAALEAGSEYFFDGPGVNSFRVLGIEASAGLDPSDVTAFVTTLSFTGDGRFTGTMTALTTPVPEPQTWALFLAGLALVAAAARRPRPRRGPAQNLV